MSQTRLILLLLCLCGQVFAQPYDFNFPAGRSEFEGFELFAEHGIYSDKVYLSYRGAGTDSLIYKLVRVDPIEKEVLIRTVKASGGTHEVYLSEGEQYWVVMSQLWPIKQHRFDIIEVNTGEQRHHYTEGFIWRTRPTISESHLYYLKNKDCDWNSKNRGDSLEVRAVRLSDGSSSTLVQTLFPPAMTNNFEFIYGAFDAERRVSYLYNANTDTTYVLDSTGYKKPFHSYYSDYRHKGFTHISAVNKKPTGFEILVFDARLGGDTTYAISSSSVVLYGNFTGKISAKFANFPLSLVFYGHVGSKTLMKVFRIDESGTVVDSVTIVSEKKEIWNMPNKFHAWSGGYAHSRTSFSGTVSNAEVNYFFLDSLGREINPGLPATRQIELYPNPSNGSLTVRTAVLDLSFSLSDSHGKLIFEKRPIEEMSWPLDLSNLSAGIYFLNFYNPDDSFKETQRLVLR